MSDIAKNIKGTQTEKNLVTAYLSESAAYTRYIYYAKQANKEMYYPLEQIFNATAENELHHGKVYFRFLEGGQVTVPVGVDAGVIGDTKANLQLAINEEQEEAADYEAYAKTAEQEGFADIAEHFRAISTVEARHKARFQKYLQMIEDGTLWKRTEPVVWQCLVCGYEVTATQPPEKCPGCDHPYQHYIAVGDDAL